MAFLARMKNKLPKNYYIGSSNSENTDKIQQVKACVNVWKDNYPEIIKNECAILNYKKLNG